MQEITPEDSIVPIYLVPETQEQKEERERWALENVTFEEFEQERQAKRNIAIAKLVKLGLTEEDLSALLG